MIKVGVEDGSFGINYPQNCSDGPITIGTDKVAFRDSMRANIPDLPIWPWGSASDAPSSLKILDMIEFCWKNIAEPSRTIPNSPSYHQHYHLLEFDVDSGREHFREEIETIFRRNGLAYQLTEEGCIERLLDQVQHEALANQVFDTGDTELDDLLNKSRLKFLDPDPEKRRESLEHLWDTWEKLRSLGGQGGVEARAKAMLDTVAGPASPKFREALEKEALEFYPLGNKLSIRHRNMNQESIARSEHADYMFHRMFSLIQLVLRLR